MLRLFRCCFNRNLAALCAVLEKLVYFLGKCFLIYNGAVAALNPFEHRVKALCIRVVFLGVRLNSRLINLCGASVYNLVYRSTAYDTRYIKVYCSLFRVNLYVEFIRRNKLVESAFLNGGTYIAAVLYCLLEYLVCVEGVGEVVLSE